ncbi:MAG: ATP-binding protein [Burkholderiaceae bacterium]
MKGFSTRFHLALGLSSLMLSALLVALYLGLVPDRDGAVRAGRLALAEAVAASSTELMDEQEDSQLRRLLGFIARRNPELLSIGLRRADGVLLIEVGEHAGAWQAQRAGVSTDAQLLVPILQGTARWGHAELRFVPLQPTAWWGVLASAPVKLIGAVVASCFALFYLYLRRMLRHLDPSRSIPGRVRTAFDTLAEGLLVLDPNGRIVLANQAFGEVVGQRGDDLIGKPAASLAWTNQAQARIHGADTPWVASLADARVRHNVVMYLEDVNKKRRTFMVNCSPVPGAAGVPAGVLVSLDDVTELEEKEIELRLARDDAQAANRAKSDFLANMSHEIRTPMNAILGFTELLRRGYQHGAADTRKYLDIIHGSGKHLLELINDILDLSKVEAGRLDVERIPCAAHRVVQDVVRVMDVRAREKGVTLRVDFPEALPATVSTDSSRLRQIVTNLVGNALKFTQQGAVIVVMRTLPDAPNCPLAIEISDTGIGIPADKLEAIFEPFVQAETSTTRQYGGTGLGLAISRRFARALGGDVTASSVPGQGSTFRVTLETGSLEGVQWLSPEVLASVKEEHDVMDEAPWQFAPARVLVVDDAAENRELVRLVLEAAGLQVSEAEHGAAALEHMAVKGADLVLMDVQMPVMDGYTATRLLRERGCKVAVLALTANAMKGFEREIEAAGFSGYLTKPVDIDAMLAELSLHLDGKRVAMSEATGDSGAAVNASGAGQGRRASTPLPDSQAPCSAAGEPIVSRLAQHPRLRRVARNFALQLPAKLQAMLDAHARGDLNELAALAHWLKGAGGTVGYDELFEPARDLEQRAKGSPSEAVGEALLQLQALAQRIVIPDEPAAAPAQSTEALASI